MISTVAGYILFYYIVVREMVTNGEGSALEDFTAQDVLSNGLIM